MNTNTQTGKVTALNGGAKFQLDGTWTTISKWAEVGTVMPSVGETVEVKIDAKGFARAIRVLEATTAPAAAKPAEQPKPEPKAQAPEQEAPRGPLPSKDVAITRMNVLTTATAMLASGGRAVDPVEAVQLAAKLEAWINR